MDIGSLKGRIAELWGKCTERISILSFEQCLSALSPIMIRQELVSVIIPTYNRANYVVELLESVFAQTYREIEVVFVNDGSTDETKALLEAFRYRISYFE